MPVRGQTAYPAPPDGSDTGHASDWVDGDQNFNGTDIVLGATPSSSVYVMGGGWAGRNTTIAANVRVRACWCEVYADVLDLGANARLDGDGNSGSGSTAGAITGINHNSGDIFGSSFAGGAGSSSTATGSANTASAGNNMGGCPGPVKAAGATAARAPTYTGVATGGVRRQFKTRSFLYTGRTFGGAAVITVHSGGSGVGGTCNVGTGTATSGGGGTNGTGLKIRCRRLRMGAGSRISARSGGGGTGVATGNGIGTGGGVGGAGWIVVDVEEEIDMDPTAQIDAFSGEPGVGSSAAYTAEYGGMGTVEVYLRGKPYPRQRVMYVGDSRTVGGGGSDADTAALGGPRAWALHGKLYKGLPWVPMGNQQNGAFGPNQMVGASGETVTQVMDRLINGDAAAFLAPIPGWPHPIVVLDVGANDAAAGTAWATSGAKYTAGLDAIFAANPNTIVISARIYDYDGFASNVSTFNTNLDALLAGRSEWGVNLHSVDYHTAVGAYSATQFANAGHVNAVGQRLAVDALRAVFVTLGL